MKVPYSWLKDYVNVGKLSAEEVAEKLTTAGLEVVLIEKRGGDSIFDIEVTPNRPDCLSILGIAREVAVVLRRPLEPPKIKKVTTKSKDKPLIEIKDEKLSPRYTGRIIRNVKVGPSAKWLVERLEKMGLRPVNNVVDITNFCLFELGQPTHAFDYDKIKGKVIVRRGRKDEKITTIDERERVLEPDMLVIADEKGAIALAGIMGGLDTEVSNSTKNIFFESACFDPVSIRRTSRRLGLASESSYRFERSVDMGGVAAASDRACGLIKELCGGEIGPIVDLGEKDPKAIKVYLRLERLKDLLGLDIPVSAIKKILLSLQLKVESSDSQTLVVSVPSFRQDLTSEVDLLEEVIRIYGYDKLPSTMPVIVGHPKRMAREREILNVIRDAAISIGADEVITYSLISKEDLNSVEETAEDRLVVIKNPLSIEQEIMRPTLIPGILRTVSWNLNRRIKNFKVFELGKVYSDEKNRFREEESLSAAFVGDGRQVRDDLIFFDMKGMLGALFERLGIDEPLFKNEGFPGFLTRIAASIEIERETIGFMGEIKKEVLERFDIKTAVFLCELYVEKLFKHVNLERRYREIPRFPSANRDVSLIVAKEVSHQEILAVIKEIGKELVANIELFDQYYGVQVPAGHRSLSYTIEYRAKERTLTDDEVNRLHLAICSALTQRLRAEIR